MLFSLAGDVARRESITHPPTGQDLADVESDVRDTGLVLPEGARVLYVLKGGEQEHLGIAVSVVADLDGAAVGDFVLGGLDDAYFAYGAGGARAYSAKTGKRLWEVHGTRNGGTPSKGKAFGAAICATGDVDGDGVPDVAIGAWRFAGDRGLVRIVSGKEGSVLATLYGPLSGSQEPVLVRGSDRSGDERRERADWTGFGAFLAPASDLDGDGRPELLLTEYEGGACRGRAWVIALR